ILVSDWSSDVCSSDLYFLRGFVADGGLISYGSDTIDLHRRAALYFDRILKGEKPAEMPVAGPTKFEFVLNLKTAKTLGLDVPLRSEERRVGKECRSRC